MHRFSIKFIIILGLLSVSFLGCKSDKNSIEKISNLPEVITTSAMKNVMWKGELFGKIKIDTLKTEGLYGLGPESYLTGEVLINDGVSYVSKVMTDSTILVVKTDHIEAPFFVHSYVQKWKSQKLPKSITSISDIEAYITNLTKNIEKPFAFKLEGHIDAAEIHIQNLPNDTKVSSPKEAHQGQVNYNLNNEDVRILGFYSKAHQGIFTHHDSFVHMHLITNNETKMGHLDALKATDLTLFLPEGL